VPAAQQVAGHGSNRQGHLYHGIWLNDLYFATLGIAGPGKNQFGLAHSGPDNLQAVTALDTVAAFHQPGPFRQGFPDDPYEITITTVQAVFGMDEGVVMVEEKTCPVRPVTNRFKLPAPPWVNLGGVRIITPGIQGCAINPGYGSNIIKAFHPTFNLQAVDSCTDQSRQMIDQAEVTAIEDVSAPVILLDRQVFTRPGLLLK
jgi:hypothetical protein